MNKQYRHILIIAVLAAGAVGLAFTLAFLQVNIGVLPLLFACGMVGGVVNNYYRIANLAQAEIAAQAALPPGVVTLQLYVSAFMAGILAVVLYGFFAGGLLEGALFPKFNKEGVANYTNLGDMLSKMTPDTNQSMAKAIIWAFIAGFSERLVPNLIDNFVADAKSGSVDPSLKVAPPPASDEDERVVPQPPVPPAPLPAPVPAGN